MRQISLCDDHLDELAYQTRGRQELQEQDEEGLSFEDLP
jgi:hypothetical protein